MERELDSRHDDGIEITLLWSPHTDRVYVAVENERTGERFRFPVDPAHALDAFRHPFAYDRRVAGAGGVAGLIPS